MPEKMIGYLQRIIDGDTLVVVTVVDSGWVDMGLGRSLQVSERQEEHVRLARVNAPENSTPAGQISTAWVRQQLTGFDHVELTVLGFDKFHRLLCEVMYGDKNLSDELLKAGEAVVYGRGSDDDSVIQPLPR